MITPTIIHQYWQALWQQYRQRVKYAQIYEEMIIQTGGRLSNDHIAFRSLGMEIETPHGKINLGIPYLEKIIQSWGYEFGGEYLFPHTHLYARHYYHPQQEEFNLPKLFLSELRVGELPDNIRQLIQQTVIAVDTLPTDNLDILKIFNRPWQPPYYSVVQTINQVSQYAAWVLIHGYAVNHFTGYINQQNTPTYPDIDATAAGLSQLGVPMKAEIEGNIHLGLRQTATHAVTEMVTVIDDITQKEIQVPWTYAYYELAQRYMIENSSGNPVLFDGFLGKNAQELFEMTRVTE
ncbi:hypothetical protein IJ00_00610 [Calothrix sp. 336/3]|nr:hypothetical protein IJ00_00610 [Calothrix sp. 336/3]